LDRPSNHHGAGILLALPDCFCGHVPRNVCKADCSGLVFVHPDGNLSQTAFNPAEGFLWQAVNNRPEPTGLRTILIRRVQYYRQGLIHNQLFQKTGDPK